MIPILSLFTLFTSFFSSIIFWRLYSSYRKNKITNIGYFAATYGSLALFFLVASVPGLFSVDPFWIQASFIFSYIPLFATSFFLMSISLDTLAFKGIKKYFLVVILFSLILTTVLGAFLSGSPFPNKIGSNFYYWKEGTPAWLQALNGIIVSFVTFGAGIFFWFGGLKSKVTIVRTRGFILGSGVILEGVGAFLNYVLAPRIEFAMLPLIAGLSAILGLITLFFGIYYRPKDNEEGSAL